MVASVLTVLQRTAFISILCVALSGCLTTGGSAPGIPPLTGVLVRHIAADVCILDVTTWRDSETSFSQKTLDINYLFVESLEPQGDDRTIAHIRRWGKQGNSYFDITYNTRMLTARCGVPGAKDGISNSLMAFNTLSPHPSMTQDDLNALESLVDAYALPLSVQWEGYESALSGLYISMRSFESSRYWQSGWLSISFPNSQDTCMGTFMPDHWATGNWELFCPNGVTASLSGDLADKVITSPNSLDFHYLSATGQGRDSLGRAITMKVTKQPSDIP